mgnify:CR=1 FL=1
MFREGLSRPQRGSHYHQPSSISHCDDSEGSLLGFRDAMERCPSSVSSNLRKFIPRPTRPVIPGVCVVGVDESFGLRIERQFTIHPSRDVVQMAYFYFPKVRCHASPLWLGCSFLAILFDDRRSCPSRMDWPQREAICYCCDVRLPVLW